MEKSPVVFFSKACAVYIRRCKLLESEFYSPQAWRGIKAAIIDFFDGKGYKFSDEEITKIGDTFKGLKDESRRLQKSLEYVCEKAPYVKVDKFAEFVVEVVKFVKYGGAPQALKAQMGMVVVNMFIACARKEMTNGQNGKKFEDIFSPASDGYDIFFPKSKSDQYGRKYEYPFPLLRHEDSRIDLCQLIEFYKQKWDAVDWKKTSRKPIWLQLSSSKKNFVRKEAKSYGTALSYLRQIAEYVDGWDQKWKTGIRHHSGKRSILNFLLYETIDPWVCDLTGRFAACKTHPMLEGYGLDQLRNVLKIVCKKVYEKMLEYVQESDTYSKPPPTLGFAFDARAPFQIVPRELQPTILGNELRKSPRLIKKKKKKLKKIVPVSVSSDTDDFSPQKPPSRKRKRIEKKTVKKKKKGSVSKFQTFLKMLKVMEDEDEDD